MTFTCFAPLDTTFKVSKHKPSLVECLAYKKCKRCPFQTLSTVSLLHHSCPTDKPCHECHRVYRTEAGLHRHIHQQHSPFTKHGDTFKCRFCTYKTIRASDMRRHISTKHSTDKDKQRKWFQCDHCAYRTAESARLRDHIFRRHSSKDGFKWLNCELCDYKTKVKTDFVCHMKKTHPLDHNRVQCRVCNLLVARGYLKTHLSRQHNDNVDKFQCQFCPKAFKWRGTLWNHTRRKHTLDDDQTWYRCEICAYKTIEKRYLNQHMVSKHSEIGDSCYRWEYCDSKLVIYQIETNRTPTNSS